MNLHRPSLFHSFAELTAVCLALVCTLMSGCADDGEIIVTGANDSSGAGTFCADAECLPLRCDGILTFDDPALESAARDALGDFVGPMMLNDVSGLRLLEAPGRGISTIGGVECLLGMDILHLINNDISDLEPLRGLVGLQSLLLHTNNVSSCSWRQHTR